MHDRILVRVTIVDSFRGDDDSRLAYVEWAKINTGHNFPVAWDCASEQDKRHFQFVVMQQDLLSVLKCGIVLFHAPSAVMHVQLVMMQQDLLLVARGMKKKTIPRVPIAESLLERV